MQKIIWSAMVGSILMLGGVILVFHFTGWTERGSGDVGGIILAMGFLSAIPFPLVRNLMGRSPSNHPLAIADEEQEVVQTQKDIRQMVLLGGIAELPVTMGLVYAALGGVLIWALALWGISLVAILSIKPEEEHRPEK